MIRRTQARTLALLAVLVASFLYVAPSGAFDAVSLGRSASVAVVTDANAYNALSTLTAPAWTCPYLAVGTSQCHVGQVTNKGAAAQAYRVMRETATGTRMADWALGGVPAESDLASPWTDWTGSKAVGESVHIIVNISACAISCGGNTYYANLTIEGKLANVWEYNQTRIMIIMPPT